MSGETEKDISGWTVDTLHSNMQTQFELRMKMLDERYATQTKATDAAFIAQQTAMKAAFDSAEKAVATALISAEKAVATALASAEKAVTKAEIAAEKRFDSQNEFRQQLGDQAATFMPRTEGEIRIQRNAERIDELTDRFNKAEARDQGGDAKAAINRAMAISVAMMVVSVVGIVVAILIALA